MSREQTEQTERQRQIATRELTPYLEGRETRAQRTRRIEREENTSDSADSESTVRASPSNEEEDLPSLLNSPSPPSNTSTLWSPSVFQFHTEELTRRVTETVLLNPRESMSNETEVDKLTRLISLMVAGQAESMKAAQLEREQRREDEACRIDAQREDEARRLRAQREEDARRE